LSLPSDPDIEHFPFFFFFFFWCFLLQEDDFLDFHEPSPNLVGMRSLHFASPFFPPPPHPGPSPSRRADPVSPSQELDLSLFPPIDIVSLFSFFSPLPAVIFFFFFYLSLPLFCKSRACWIVLSWSIGGTHFFPLPPLLVYFFFFSDGPGMQVCGPFPRFSSSTGRQKQAHPQRSPFLLASRFFFFFFDRLTEVLQGSGWTRSKVVNSQFFL